MIPFIHNKYKAISKWIVLVIDNSLYWLRFDFLITIEIGTRSNILEFYELFFYIITIGLISVCGDYSYRYVSPDLLQKRNNTLLILGFILEMVSVTIYQFSDSEFFL